jgi:hypothetical protein
MARHAEGYIAAIDPPMDLRRADRVGAPMATMAVEVHFAPAKCWATNGLVAARHGAGSKFRALLQMAPAQLIGDRGLPALAYPAGGAALGFPHEHMFAWPPDGMRRIHH